MTNEEFALVMQQHENFVFTICYQLVRDHYEAQNLTQDAFYAAYRHIDECDSGAYKPWLARIASNKAKDYLKSAYMRRVSLTPEGMAQPPPELQTPDRIYEAKETSRAIVEKIHSLKEPYLKVSVLYFEQERSIEEIAALLNRPKKTVQTQLYRARQLLQELLGKEAGT